MQTSKRHLAGLAAVSVTVASVGALALPLASDIDATPHHWSYSGESGPTRWSAMDAQFTTCGNGKAQSPIDLESRDAKKGKAGEFNIDYEKGDVALVNNGHTVQANVSDAKDTVVFDGDTYRLAQFHFHSPSEHTTDGTRFPLEIHFVNDDAHKRVLVVGVMVKLGSENESLAPVFHSLPAKSRNGPDHASKAIPVDLASVLPGNHEAFVYRGSLTTPPCTEGVQWVVLSHPIQMSKEQIASFSKLFPDNHRPLQKINGREIDDDPN
ncbi:MAG TPA: carbonic anhydrase family protein [Dyella sp.]|uniref:carbonic anhydrase n=1 Tax=Dyella sp. TaxID=1869338 RepID=UPI002D78D73B|nr:carbonic anhydrase family protein [Dyella sp.]HET6554818.1 carbonic anhydrase family protein [Dyella sp.]